MAPERIGTQHAVALGNPDTVSTTTLMQMRMEITVTVFLISFQLIGACFTRHPPGSTERYTRWCNTLTPSQLYTQAFTAFGPTIILPTWFCSREVYDKAGPFCEDGRVCYYVGNSSRSLKYVDLAGNSRGPDVLL